MTGIEVFLLIAAAVIVLVLLNLGGGGSRPRPSAQAPRSAYDPAPQEPEPEREVDAEAMAAAWSPVPEDETKAAIRRRWDHIDKLLAESSIDFASVQGRHGLHVIVGSIMLAEYHQPLLWEWVIDEAARRAGEPEFEQFVREPDVREGLRVLHYDATHYTLNRSISGLGEAVQSYLLIAGRFDGPSALPVEKRAEFLNLQASIVADTLTNATTRE